MVDRTLWRRLVHVADPTWWDKALLLLLLLFKFFPALLLRVNARIGP